MAIKKLADRLLLLWEIQSSWVTFYFIVWIGYFSYFWLFVFEYNEQGGLTVGQANMWADWALHFTMGHAMAYRELFLEQSPLLINGEFSYPFAINLISALLLKAGLSMVPAFVIPSYIFSIILVFALYYFLNTLFNHKTVAVLGAFLFFLNGGVGFVYFLQDILSATNGWETFVNPPKEYTHLADKQIKWMSVINSIIIPQRSFTMGFGLTLVALGIVVKSFSLTQYKENKPISKNYLWSAAILGVMPIIHVHSFLAAFVFLSCWSISDLVISERQDRVNRLKHWSLLAGLTTLISLPILFNYYVSHIGSGFIKWYPGWYAKEFNMNWFLFWFKNWTFVPFLALIAFIGILVKANNHKDFICQFGLFLPVFATFALINLVILQPWIWDNTKLLAWAAVPFSGLTAWLIVNIFKWKNNCFVKVVVFSITTVLILSGFIDAYRNIRLENHRYQMYSGVEFELAKWVKQNTPINSKWLVANKHNHWLFNLTGRQAIFTYNGWLWSHGYDYRQTQADIKQIFKTADKNLIQKYAIDYIVVDNQIIKANGLSVLIFNLKFQRVKKIGQYQIFKTSLLMKD